MTVVLAGLLSAVVGALFALGFTEWREARQRVRTLVGYAKLLDAELEANGRVMATLQETSLITWDELVKLHGESPPSDEAWRAVREPLATMIKTEDFDKLNEYYRRLRVLLVLQARPGKAEYETHPKHLPAHEISSELMGETPELRVLLSQYANPPRRVRLLGF